MAIHKAQAWEQEKNACCLTEREKVVLRLAAKGLTNKAIGRELGIVERTAAFQGSFQDPEGLSAGTQAPFFSLINTEGQTVSLADFAGEPLLLVFSSTTCPACQEMYPTLKEFSDRFTEMQVVMISLGTEEENKSLVRERGFTFSTLNWHEEVAEAYLVSSIPQFYVINEEGVIANGGFAASMADLERLAGIGN